MEETYNGWKNYATWCVALWLGNDEGLYHEAILLSNHGEIDQSISLVKTWVTEDMNPLNEQASSLYSDLLGRELQQVDWLAVVQHFREEEEDQDDA